MKDIDKKEAAPYTGDRKEAVPRTAPSPPRVGNVTTDWAISGGSLSGSSHGRQSFSQNLAPLQVEKYSSSYGSGAAPPLSAESEKVVSKRIEELSQLQSPLLRELAKRLSEVYQIHTPRYEPNRAKQHPYVDFPVGERWQEIQGVNDWDGLLEPLDLVLRHEIVRYGEFAQATYDAFDKDRESKYCGSSKFSKAQLLERVGLENRGYEITEFLYSTTELPLPNVFIRSADDDAWSKDSNWMGYVAVCTSPEEIARLGRRDIVIAWRGTMTTFEWISDLQDYMIPTGFDPRHESETEHVMVESGFLSVYKSSNERSRYNKTSARQQVLKAVRDLVNKYQHEQLSITITGHSLGSALATLCAYDIAESGMNMTHNSPGIPTHWYGEWDSQTSNSKTYQAKEADLWKANNESTKYKESKGLRDTVVEYVKDLLDVDDDIKDLSSLAKDRVREYINRLRTDEDDGALTTPVQVTSTVSHPTRDEYPERPHRSKFPHGRIPVTVYSFGGPRVGNTAFAKRMKKLGIPVLRVVNEHDLVPEVPGVDLLAKPMELLHGIARIIPSYQHVGVELLVDNFKSPYLRETKNPSWTHNLEGYLHLVDGYHSLTQPFKRCIRDVALVNKSADYLKPEFFIPPQWWQEENKGLIRDENGHWMVPERDPELFPDTPICQTQSAQDRDFTCFFRSVSIAMDRSKALERSKTQKGAK